MAATSLPRCDDVTIQRYDRGGFKFVDETERLMSN
jgi:hypothetical protein